MPEPPAHVEMGIGTSLWGWLCPPTVQPFGPNGSVLSWNWCSSLAGVCGWDECWLDPMGVGWRGCRSSPDLLLSYSDLLSRACP